MIWNEIWIHIVRPAWSLRTPTSELYGSNRLPRLLLLFLFFVVSLYIASPLSSSSSSAYILAGLLLFVLVFLLRFLVIDILSTNLLHLFPLIHCSMGLIFASKDVLTEVIAFNRKRTIKFSKNLRCEILSILSNFVFDLHQQQWCYVYINLRGVYAFPGYIVSLS